MPLTGTLINVATVLVGTAVGILFGARLPDRVRETLLHALGLLTLVVGIREALGAFEPPLSALTRGSVLVVMGSVLLGGLVGEAARIEDRLERAGKALERRLGGSQARFTEGFVTASLVFCVGPMTILGSIQGGLAGDHQLLAIKALLDGFAAVALASALGWGVGFSVITILVYQGGLALGAASLADVFTPVTIAAITAVGGVLILGIGLRLLELRRIRVGNLLPALVLGPLAFALLEALG